MGVRQAVKNLFVFETKTQQKVRENYRLSVRQRKCVLLKKNMQN